MARTGTQEPDPAAWVDRHGDYLYRYALLHINDSALAQDLVQDTFLSALGALSSFRGESQERTWLTGILKRKIIDYYRKKRPDFSIDAFATPELASDFQDSGGLRGHWNPERAPRDWGVSPDRLVENKEFMDILHRCIRQLPEHFASVFVLREIDGHTTEEICKFLDITPSNVWVMLHRARHLLRNCMEINWLELDKPKTND